MLGHANNAHQVFKSLLFVLLTFIDEGLMTMNLSKRVMKPSETNEKSMENKSLTIRIPK